MESWLLDTFDIKSLDIESVSEFIGNDVSTQINDFTKIELITICVFHIIDTNKHKSIKMNKKEKYFFVNASYIFNTALQNLNLDIDIEELWETS